MFNKKCIKVSYLGETKRLKMNGTYEALALQTRERFGQGLERVWPIKFYYLDDERELISITSQADLLEAMSIEDLASLKLIVAQNSQDALSQFEQNLSESMQFVEQLNQSQLFIKPFQNKNQITRTNAEVSEKINPQAMSPVERKNVQVNGITNLMNDVKMMVKEVVSDVRNFFEHKSFQPLEKESNSDYKVEESMKQQITCFKCGGSKIFHKKPCVKCNGSGEWPLTAKVIELVKKDVGKFFTSENFKNSYNELLSKQVPQQIYKGITCDGCQATPIYGILFKCSECPDFKLCQQCETNGLHSQHVMLKIRKPDQVPLSYSCQSSASVQNQQLNCEVQPVVLQQEIEKIQVQTKPTILETEFEILKACELQTNQNEKTAETQVLNKFDDSNFGDKQIEDCESFNSQSFVKPVTMPYSYLYAAKVGNENDVQLRECLKVLGSLGFSNFERNKIVLKQSEMNIEAATDQLLDEAELYD